MSDILQFTNRAEFQNWLGGNCQPSAGVWLLFGKSGGPKTLTTAEAKKNGMWDAQDLMKLSDEQIEVLSDSLKEYESAYVNYQNMPPFVRKTYARAYYNVRTDARWEKRLAWIIDRLNKNLRPI